MFIIAHPDSLLVFEITPKAVVFPYAPPPTPPTPPMIELKTAVVA